MKAIFIFIFTSTIFLFGKSVLASGSYTPSGAALSKSSYNEGKAIYHGRKDINGFPGCVSCHQSENKISRKDINHIGLVIETYLEHCDELENCETENITNLHWEALMYFLQKRYRIK